MASLWQGHRSASPHCFAESLPRWHTQHRTPCGTCMWNDEHIHPNQGLPTDGHTFGVYIRGRCFLVPFPLPVSSPHVCKVTDGRSCWRRPLNHMGSEHELTRWGRKTCRILYPHPMRSDSNPSQVNVARCSQYMGLHILSGLLGLENIDILFMIQLILAANLMLNLQSKCGNTLHSHYVIKI